MYKVYYRQIESEKIHEIPDVVADGLIAENPNIRWFQCKDGMRYEIPLVGIVFQFSPERQAIVEERQNRPDVMPIRVMPKAN